MGSICTSSQPMETLKPSPTLTLRHFKYISTLGKGAYSRVILARRKQRNELFAIKIYKKSKISTKLSQIRRERQILLDVNDEFFVKLFHVFESQTRICFVLEFVIGGNLGFHIKELGNFPIDTAKFYAAEVLQGLENLHSIGYVFRDLKPDNVLIDRYGHVKFADFNLSTSSKQTVIETTGTPEYAAPEIIMQDDQGLEVDFWAFGVLIYHMIEGKTPFEGSSQNETIDKIIEGNVVFNKNFNEDSKDLIRRLLKKYSCDRLCNIDVIKAHEFFNGINWENVKKRNKNGPLKLKFSKETDLRYFTKKKYSDLVVDEKDKDSCCSDLSYNSDFEG